MAPLRRRVLLSTALLIATNVQEAAAFSDHAKSLIARIAMNNMPQAIVDKYERALKCDGGNEAGLEDAFATIPDAAVWLDKQRCRNHTTGLRVCAGLREHDVRGTEMYDIWQMSKRAYTPDGWGPIPLIAQVGDEDPSDRTFPTAIAIMGSVDWIFRSRPTGSRTWGFHIRILLNLFASVHNPTNTVDLYNANFPDGDGGGAKISTSRQSTLKEVWSTCAGACDDDWPVEDLFNKARTMTRRFPPVSLIFDGRLNSNWNVESSNYGLSTSSSTRRTDMRDMVHETREAHREFIYAEYLNFDDVDGTRTWEPSAEYLTEVEERTMEQIALAGYRLASWLNAFAQYVPENTCDPNDFTPDEQPAMGLIGRSLVGMGMGGILGLLVSSIARVKN